jgi:integrase/recombinase XerD
MRVIRGVSIAGEPTVSAAGSARSLRCIGAQSSSAPSSRVRWSPSGHALVDDYLGFIGARARPNTLLATAFDLKVFFSVVEKDPAEVTRADVFTFLKSQRTSNDEAKIVPLEDGERGSGADRAGT